MAVPNKRQDIRGVAAILGMSYQAPFLFCTPPVGDNTRRG
jgi:hypothetical protein